MAEEEEVEDDATRTGTNVFVIINCRYFYPDPWSILTSLFKSQNLEFKNENSSPFICNYRNFILKFSSFIKLEF